MKGTAHIRDEIEGLVVYEIGAYSEHIVHFVKDNLAAPEDDPAIFVLVKTEVNDAGLLCPRGACKLVSRSPLCFWAYPDEACVCPAPRDNCELRLARGPLHTRTAMLTREVNTKWLPAQHTCEWGWENSIHKL